MGLAGPGFDSQVYFNQFRVDIQYCLKVYRCVGINLDLITAMIAEYRKVAFSVTYQKNVENLNRKWRIETLFLKGVYNFCTVL